MYLLYLNTTQISVKSKVFEGFFGKLLFRIVNKNLLRLKISLARSAEYDEKWPVFPCNPTKNVMGKPGVLLISLKALGRKAICKHSLLPTGNIRSSTKQGFNLTPTA